jgi:hypothetical protein
MTIRNHLWNLLLLDVPRIILALEWATHSTTSAWDSRIFLIRSIIVLVRVLPLYLFWLLVYTLYRSTLSI